MRRIRIQNPQVDKTYRTYINADYNLNDTDITVASTKSFATNELVLFGEPTEEFTEIKKISTVDGVDIFNIPSDLNFPHTKGTPVYKLIWDFISIEGRSTSSGTFAEISQSGLQYDNKLNETVYYHQSGTDSWEYRFRFYNSVTLTYSEYSTTLTGAVPGRRSVGYMIREVRKIIGDLERKIISDEEIIRCFNRAQDIIYATNPKYWFLKTDTRQVGTGSILAVADTGTYSLANLSNFGHIDMLRYEFNSNGNHVIYPLARKGDVEYDEITRDLNRGTDDYPIEYNILPPDDNSEFGYIQVNPTIKTSNVGTFYITYFQKMADLNSVDDLTKVPLPSLLEDYAISYGFSAKGDESKATIYESRFYGPSDKGQDTRVLTGIKLLDQMDDAQKKSAGELKYLWRYKGRASLKRLYGSRFPQSADYVRENYF